MFLCRSIEVWSELVLIRRDSDIYMNELHVSGGELIVNKIDDGVRYHEHDFLGTTLWSMDTKGNLVKDYQDTTIFGEGSIQKDRSARFTGKPYDEDLQAYVFPYRNYDATTARWRTSDPAGYPDGINNQFYAAVPTKDIDVDGMWIVTATNFRVDGPIGTYNISEGERFNAVARGSCTITIRREATDTKDFTYFFSAALVSSVGTTRMLNERVDVSITTAEHVINVTVPHAFVGLSEGIYSYYFTISAVSAPTPERQFSIVEK